MLLPRSEGAQAISEMRMAIKGLGFLQDFISDMGRSPSTRNNQEVSSTAACREMLKHGPRSA